VAVDSGFFKDWNLIQVEGEEPAEQKEEEVKAPVKGKPPPKAAPKGGA